MTGYSGSTLRVNDPGFEQTTYPLSQVGKAGAYSKVSGVFSLIDKI